jgi:hypothetical protein
MEPQQGTVLIGVVLVAVDLAIRIAALIGSNIMGTRSFALREATPFQCDKEPLRVTAPGGLTRPTSVLQ